MVAKIYHKTLEFRGKGINQTDKRSTNPFLLKQIPSIFLSFAWLFFGVTTYGHFIRDIRGNHPSPLINKECQNGSMRRPILYAQVGHSIPMDYFG